MDGRHNTTVKNFVTLGIGLAFLLLFGTIGYVIIEGYALLDAIYMTFITFSTVGFGEVRPLGVPGRVFTILLILFGVVILAMLSATVTSLFVKQELLNNFRRKRMKKEIQKLKGHTILCGAGETGKTVIEEFQQAKKELVVIEEDEEVIEYLAEQYPNLLILAGDATKDEVLEEANIKQASALITALSEDTANLFVVISARSLNPDLKVIARAVDPHTAGKMYKAGATHVVSPNLTEGIRMAAVVLRPNVVNFLDVVTRDQEIALRLEEVTVPPDSAFHKKSLRELEIPQRTGLIVIAIIKQVNGASQFIYNPQSSTVVEGGDQLIVLGEVDRVEKLHRLLRDELID